MVDHHAVTNLHLPGVNAFTNRSDYAAWFMTRDDRSFRSRHAVAESLTRRLAIGDKIAAAHTRCLHLNHDLIRSRRRVRKIHEGKLLISQKYDTVHVPLRQLVRLSPEFIRNSIMRVAVETPVP